MSLLTARSQERGLLFDLLAYAATDPASGSVQGIPARRLEEVDHRQMQWVSDAGLAPLLYRASREGIDQVRAARREMLLGADLAAIAWSGNLIDATREIVEACEARGVRVTLLKGISISDQYYPDAHLRPMGDIDVLVSPPAVTTVESTILQLGYRRKPHHQHREGAHHGAPLLHPERRVWVEVHNALFSEDASLRSGRVFSPLHVAAHSVSATFHGSVVNRLADELQLVYIASSWVRDLSRYGIHASFVPPLLDAIYLLNATDHTLDWDELLGWLDNPMAVASLYVMLSYLSRNSLYQVDPPILSRLASSQDVIGPSVLRVLHRMLDKYLVGGRAFSRFPSDWHVSIVLSTLLAPGSSGRKLASVPWNILFPPSVAERYSVRYQFGRIAKALRGKA
jgi:Uncharacterised nucleotidyltransferase